MCVKTIENELKEKKNKMEDPGSQILIQLLVVVILTAINAFFAAAEIALVSVNKNRLKVLADEGNKKAGKVLNLVKDSTRFLSTIQVAITLSGFLSSGSAATGIAPYVGDLFGSFGLPRAYTIAFILVTLVLSYITLVFGELVPKQIAMKNAERIALGTISVVSFVAVIANPFVKLLSASTNVIMKLFGMDNTGIEEQVTKEEIHSLVVEGQISGVFNESETEMLNGIFSFDDKIAKEVMTPRTEVFAIDINDKIQDYMDDILEQMYSRIPIYDGDIDNIIGVLYMKDFLAEAYKVGFSKIDIRKIMQEPYFVPERKSIGLLFHELQETKKHIALLLDEYGGFSGIVTIEDLIEEILGEIEDEFDNEEPEIVKIDDTTYELKGILHIVDLNEALNLDFDENSEEYDSIGGLLIDILGHIPSQDEADIKYRNYLFHIAEVRENRVEKVIMTILPEEEKEDETKETEK